MGHRPPRKAKAVRAVTAGLVALCTSSVITTAAGTKATAVRKHDHGGSLLSRTGGLDDSERYISLQQQQQQTRRTPVQEELFDEQAFLEKQDQEHQGQDELFPVPVFVEKQKEVPRQDPAALWMSGRGDEAAQEKEQLLLASLDMIEDMHNSYNRVAWGEEGEGGGGDTLHGQEEEMGRGDDIRVAAAAAGIVAGLLAAVGAALASVAPAALADLLQPATFFSGSSSERGEPELSWAHDAFYTESAGERQLEKPGGLRGASSFISSEAGGAEASGGVRRALQGTTPAPVDAVPPTPEPDAVSDTPSPSETEPDTPTPQPAALPDTPTPSETEPDTPSPLLEPTPADEPTTPTPGDTPSPVAATTETPSPLDAATETLEPSIGDTTVAPDETLSPAEAATETPAPTSDSSLEPGSSPAPTPVEASPAPTPIDASPAPTPTDASPAPTSEVASMAPASVAPIFFDSSSGPSVNDSDTTTPSPATTPSPFTELPVTASPTESFTPVEEALDTTGEVASTSATVAVATTAAAATIAATTATTATTAAAVSTTSAVTTSLTTTVTTVATTTATGGTGTGTTTTALTTTGAVPDGTTTFNTSANPSSGATMGTDPNSISSRSPSATLGLLLIFQMQFVSLLRLLEANITKPFMNFVDSLKWLNLHFEVDISFFSCDEEEASFDWTNNDNGTWAFNTFLVFSLLVLLIVVHILLVSYLEASWLSRANAIHRHRLEFMRKRSAEEVVAPFDGRTEAAYAKYLDDQNYDRDLHEQEVMSTERYLKRHNSVWMYFPHVELLFLLFTYQGASAAEARMIHSGCFPLVVLGFCALVVFPVLMFLYVSRIVWGRVRPAHSSPLRFEPNPNAKRGCFLFKACRGICTSWIRGSSMFSWADKGQWTSKNNEDIDIDSRKFRIGFEPLFVDYTQRGSLYVSFLLFEWFAFGLIAGFVTNGTYQTGAIFVIYVVDFLLLVCLKPFANGVIQCFTTVTVFADAVTLALMCLATFLDKEDDSEDLDALYAVVLMVQMLAILFFVIPLYMDAFITILGTLCRKCSEIVKGTASSIRTPIKGSSSETASIFCALLRENFVGCVKSTWRGPSYKPKRQTELQRRRSSLLMPGIQEEYSSDESHTFGRLPSGAVRPSGVPRSNPRSMSQENTLQDVSSQESGSYRGAGSHTRGRSGAPSSYSGTSGYSRSSSAQGGRR